jgi:hypothetical protein
VADDEAVWDLFGGDDEVRAAPPVADEIWVPPYAGEIDDASIVIGSLIKDDDDESMAIGSLFDDEVSQIAPESKPASLVNDDESMVIGSLFDDDEVPQIAPESKPAKSVTDDTMPRVSIRRSHESFTSPSFATKSPQPQTSSQSHPIFV